MYVFFISESVWIFFLVNKPGKFHGIKEKQLPFSVVVTVIKLVLTWFANLKTGLTCLMLELRPISFIIMIKRCMVLLKIVYHFMTSLK